MQIHRVQGRDIKDALERARGLIGDDAVVLGHETVPSGGVTVSVARTSASKAETRPRRASDDAEDNPGLRDVQRRLLRHGCSSKWSANLRGAVAKRGGRGTHAIDIAASIISRAVAVAPSPKVGRKAQAIAFVGPTGVGKTTSLAKLAVLLTRAGRRVGIISLDTYRAGAVEQLTTYAEILGCHLDVAADDGELRSALERSKHLQVVLVDTTGRSPGNAGEIARLQATLAHGAEVMPVMTHLVLAATTQRADLRDALGAYKSLRPDAAVLTKFDETGRPGAVIESVARARLGIGFLADGQDVAGHFRRPPRGGIADLLLRGRLA